jgi:thiosulfate/3-mercaptopyruvate sulfurtransferase
MGRGQSLICADELQAELGKAVLLDCRFDLMDKDAGARGHAAGHIPGAHYLHLERDLSGPVGPHGGRHPLPDPAVFARRLANLGIDRQTPVVAYDDNGFMPAARLWWMLRALDYPAVRLLDGGIAAWTAAGGALETDTPRAPPVGDYRGRLSIDGVRQAITAGALLVDCRDEARYQGLEEPIDPVAGHIPGAVNLPWQGATDATGFALDEAFQEQRLAPLNGDRQIVLYCGSGVSACVNLFALHLLGRDDAALYAGSWSDWCSWMEQ